MSDNNDFVVAELVVAERPTLYAFWSSLSGPQKFSFFVLISNCIIMFMTLSLVSVGHRVAQQDRLAQLEQEARVKAKRRRLNDADRARAYVHLALIQLQRGKEEEALAHFEFASDLDSTAFAESEEATDFAVALYSKHQFPVARAAFDLIVTAKPSVSNPYLQYSYLLATSPSLEMRDGKKAVQIAQIGLKKEGQDDRYALEVAAAAYAERGNNGDFEEAIRLQERALAAPFVASSDDQNWHRLRMEYALRLYKKGLPLLHWTK